MYLSDVGRAVEPEDCACDVESNALGHAGDVLVECATHVVVVAENERFLWVEADSDDVCCVCACVALDLLNGALLAEEELLVVGHHDNKWYVEDILQPPREVLASHTSSYWRENSLGEREWNSVSNVHGVTTWSTTSVEEEWLALLITIEDNVQISVTENNASAHKSMWLVSCNSLESLQRALSRQQLCAKLLHQAHVVDGLGDSICADFSLNVPWVNDLLSGGVWWERWCGLGSDRVGHFVNMLCAFQRMSLEIF